MSERLRKCCPSCGKLAIDRKRRADFKYKCTFCKAVFNVPGERVVLDIKIVPPRLKKFNIV